MQVRNVALWCVALGATNAGACVPGLDNASPSPPSGSTPVVGAGGTGTVGATGGTGGSSITITGGVAGAGAAPGFKCVVVNAGAGGGSSLAEMAGGAGTSSIAGASPVAGAGGSAAGAGGAAAGDSSIAGTGGTTAGTGGTAAGTGGTAAGTGGTGPYVSPQSGLVEASVGPPPEETACGTPDQLAVPWPFLNQELWDGAPARRVLYSWTTAEQAGELRAGGPLLSRTETPGLGRGYAFTSIDNLAARGSEPENQLLQKLSSELFTKVRYAWPSAWATRMGWPGEDYGDQLLRIVLRPEAWILMVDDTGAVALIDMNNQLVAFSEATAHPERIGAVFFTKLDISGTGTFDSCSGGYREFIVGNEAMIEEWSLGTEQIRAQLAADADLLESFLEQIRPNPPGYDAASFNRSAACTWTYAASDPVTSYMHALSIPSEYYVPTPSALATLIDTLRASLFDPDPLVVKPGGG